MAALSMVTPATISTCILLATLLLFASERVRRDLVVLIALFASIVTGLVKPGEAFSGFSDPAVLAVAGVLVVGRALASCLEPPRPSPRSPFPRRLDLRCGSLAC